MGGVFSMYGKYEDVYKVWRDADHSPPSSAEVKYE
jgi:hypothetical protein